MRTISTTLSLVVIAMTGQMATANGAETPEQVQARRDQLRIAVQEICPVSGQELGKMGPPVKVTVGDAKEEIFLCCKGCLKGRINPEYWATIHANIARAQGRCPVMKNELPNDAKWTVVKGELVYVCCPPCIKKLTADPDKYLQQVDAYYTAYLRSKQTR
jgi:hypothetical protein